MTAIMPVEAHIIEPLGAYDIVDLKVGDAVAARPHPRAALSSPPATRVFARLDAAQTHFFDTRSGNSLRCEAW